MLGEWGHIGMLLAVGISLPTVPSRILGHSRIRAPPSLHCFFI